MKLVDSSDGVRVATYEEGNPEGATVVLAHGWPDSHALWDGVVPLLADWTDGSPEIKDVLTALKSNSIPVVAIFPADRPNEAIVLRDLISQTRLLDALKRAGPSQSAAAVKETAMK